ncbi:MAG: phenylalanine--tRNA ligase subunit beta [Desulfarculus sp.]|nr:phenylalanine--tRNA ligase subunit beta [Pseudomonadota bacterium]MBV1715451.1 phenylalanine--tRNA ligase subunit beta [Desulfarculus sp.]MBU4573265.1 phenylalanine--tRNA ligase subunit beta [Pseudomonadota bacterium]MBU4599281.1 phenylalanine--tRNA ligase subunit beta [Pseudomonadota bacterium]MBV1739702.1 phenylalanine--tRNA ligase subunit beta [Desulfarculus sp.]
MLVPLKWLREMVDCDLTAQELSDLLTNSGLEVDGVIERHSGLNKVITAKLVEVAPHPNADRLRLATVDCGGGRTETVVCGAPNLTVGMITPLAQLGAKLGEDGQEVSKVKIRGVQSCGMLCSERDLGLSDDHSGLMVLDPGLEPGLLLAEVLELETQVLEISITPNRGDALSILGVARDVAALVGAELKLPPCEPSEQQPGIEGQAVIEVLDAKACPRYTGRLVKGVKIGPSPLWMRDRLMACGIRPISNVVDVTNYILMELGQPLHAFNFSEVGGAKIVVRMASEGEKFVTLDGQERTLNAQDLMICDAEKAVGLAGVMGGLNSEVTDDTTEVLIESAFFDPLTVRRTSKRLGLSTEASYRFERGIDLEGCARANSRAAMLMDQLAGGKVAAGIIDVYPVPYQAPRIPLSISRTSRYLGLPLTKEQVKGQLERLGLAVSDGPDEDSIVAEPPALRTDLERPVDLTEEVARMVGFNNIPSRLPQAEIGALARPWPQRVRALARDAMAAQGLDEAINYSFEHPKAADRLALEAGDYRRRTVKLINPLSEEQSELRTSLLPGLLASAARNLAHRVLDVGLFEIGRVFVAQEGQPLPEESFRLGVVLSGLMAPASWWAGEQPVGLSHVKGVAQYLAEALDLTGMAFETGGEAPPYLDPAEWCRITINGEVLGELGRLDNRVAKGFDLDRPVYLLDAHFDRLADLVPREKVYAHLPRFPELVRDVALVVAEALPAGEMLAQARTYDDPWLQSVEIFDVYRGKPLDKGQKSLGLRFTYRAEDRTLTEEEVTPGYQALVDELMKSFGATLRA